MTTGSFPPYARMIGDRFDVSAYCREPLVAALDHLSSVKFAVFSLVRPALKIAARSLFIEDETITFSNILSHLNSDTPITAPPPEAQPQRPKRSFSQRVIHFFTVGIPLAIIVGILAGLLHLIKNFSHDITTVITNVNQLYSMSQRDVKFYKENPQLLPSRNKAIDEIVNTGLSFYTRRLIYKKLGIFSFIAKPFMTLIENLLIKRIIKFCDQIDKLRNRYNNRTMPPSAPPAPSAPMPPPYYNDKSDDFKYD
ncbi:unnamed protein product [Rotaria sordida]|uniref:Uncharacterized protein n=1 Tax=Rotaria sordida TaxID=392033 RepID=A0A813XK16_9BILA|nr:unnamed protein product [Rotaria sordida]